MVGGIVPEIVVLDTDNARRSLSDLVALLQDAVAGGASIGFLPPLGDVEAAAYWEGVLADLATGERVLLVAMEQGRVGGGAQLALATRANGSHRCSVRVIRNLTPLRERTRIGTTGASKCVRKMTWRG